MSRVCDFPLYFTDKNGKDQVIFVDASDYVRHVSGERTIREAFGHYLLEEDIVKLEEYERDHPLSYI